MIKYSINENSKEKIYGIYDWLKETENRSYNIKTFGVIFSDKYIFEVDVADHYEASHRLATGVNDYFWCSTRNSDRLKRLYIDYSKNPKVDVFICESVIGMLNECIKYKKEKNIEIKVKISGLLFVDNLERDGYDLENMIKDLNKKIDVIKEDIDLEFISIDDIEEEPVKLSNVNINKLKEIFKRIRNKKL